MLKPIKVPALHTQAIADAAAVYADATAELKAAERAHPIAGRAVHEAERLATTAAVAAGKVVTAKELQAARDAAHIELSKALLRLDAAKAAAAKAHAALRAAVDEYLDDPATLDLCIHEWVHEREEAVAHAAALQASLARLGGIEATYVSALGSGSASFADQATISELRYRLDRVPAAIYAAPADNRGVAGILQSA